jgi:hypothetical protein
MPMFIYWYRIWSRTLKMTTDRRETWIYALMLFSIIVPILTFAIQGDWSRYLGAFLFNLSILMLALYTDENSKLKWGVQKTNELYIERYGNRWQLVLIIYLVILSSIRGCKTALFVNEIPDTFLNMFNMFMN